MRNLLRYFGKRARANRANKRGNALSNEGRIAEALKEYQRAQRLAPEWSAPEYNLGLHYKYTGDWQRSLQHNLNARQLAPGDVDVCWNLGIAATALRKWDVARGAWRDAGIPVPEGDGPVEYACGTTPIRLNPDADAEVVWAERIDPARAILRSIPLPESGFHFGDLVLHDGAAVGRRMLNGRDVPVFNCLELLEPSQFATWILVLEIVDEAGTASIERLIELANERDLSAENWTTSIQAICKACSEGLPHTEHDETSLDPKRPHRIGIAAPNVEEANRLIDDWKLQATGVTIQSLDAASHGGTACGVE